ncbi:MAG: DUF3373 domain-containing protein [Deltaproteobacteria bacterium HGW-Deltaproteobacteria-4]|nr:MAG: DUF3373 domain-containing protein [Deltaproteobacteria bacterium HGW-Deltaproteobacteria-4]
MKKFVAICATALFLAPAVLCAETGTAELQLKLDELTKELAEISSRVDATEKHTATDRIQFTGDLRVKADTLHYQDSTWNPAIKVDYTDFFNKVGAAMGPGPSYPLGTFGAFNPNDPDGDGNPLTNGPVAVDYTQNPSALDKMFSNLYTQNQAMYYDLFTKMNNYFGLGQVPGVGPFPLLNTAPKTGDIDNDILYTTRLRLNMKANVADNVDFAGRLAMYKNWGDSTGVKVFDSWNAFTMDGTDGGNTTGDFLRVERAYFDWKDIGGSNLYLSIGRRPSTYGPPGQYRENEMRGGTPSGHLVNFNFDGITAGYKLGEHTGVEGQVVRFCYGQGFESQVGNGELYGDITTKDTHLGGFNVDVINDGTNFVQLTAFAAMDVVDGFKGTFAFPTQLAAIFAPTMYQDMQKFPTFNFVTRYQPSSVIGDIMLAGIGAAREEDNGLNYFGSLGWTQLRPNGEAGLFGGMGTDAVFEAQLNADGSEVIMMPARAENDDNHDGYGIYAGVQIPAPAGKLGLEYNYGSKYWTPFTQAQDDMLGSKLATRGHVGEAYYIFDINPNMFIKVGGLYYDYEYTNSGSPVGAPQKVSDVLDGTAYSMLPVADTAWDGYASLTVKF